ncbi:HNH endonuclease signature motif containing protein [Garicola koreensis]|uniref:HNH endonuclease n=2 Tax=Garicola koreensis TaxID=1262554 RepID=UPI0031F050A6
MDQLPVLDPPMPQAVELLGFEPELAAAWEHQAAARKAEAAKLTALLDYTNRVVAECHAEGGIPHQEAVRDAHLEAAMLLGVSDMTAGVILDAAGFARNHLPATWQAFHTGLIDLVRLRKIVDAGCELDDHVLALVDAAAAEQAAARSTSDFAHWLARYIAQTDFEAYERLTRTTRTRRHVQFAHLPNGMSIVSAFLPTIEAAAIEKRLKIITRRQHAAAKDTAAQDTAATDTAATDAQQGSAGSWSREHGAGAGEWGRPGQAGESPTLAQREADVFSAWLRTNPTGEPAPVEAKIMIMVPEATLTGDTNEPAISAHRSWALDADQARALAGDPHAQHDWYEGVTRPRAGDADVDVLTVTYSGRYPPQRLREAIIFRDGRCQTQGCTVAAERCDLDHQTPWDSGGQTNAANLWSLCRRHHRLKSHGHLHPPPRGDTEPTASRPPVIDLWLPTHTYPLIT